MAGVVRNPEPKPVAVKRVDREAYWRLQPLLRKRFQEWLSENGIDVDKDKVQSVRISADSIEADCYESQDGNIKAFTGCCANGNAHPHVGTKRRKINRPLSGMLAAAL